MVPRGSVVLTRMERFFWQDQYQTHIFGTAHLSQQGVIDGWIRGY